MRSGRRGEGRPPRVLLTVSPVPLTATASGQHVLVATVQSKSVLRAVAGEICAAREGVDYFPSYEIVSNPWSGTGSYAANLRSVTDAAVDRVMRTFLAVHRPAEGEAAGAPPAVAAEPVAAEEEDEAMRVRCDEELLDAFGRGAR
jgi:hypothetical protein